MAGGLQPSKRAKRSSAALAPCNSKRSSHVIGCYVMPCDVIHVIYIYFILFLHIFVKLPMFDYKTGRFFHIFAVNLGALSSPR